VDGLVQWLDPRVAFVGEVSRVEVVETHDSIIAQEDGQRDCGDPCRARTYLESSFAFSYAVPS
jgi:hypothetical protein